MINDVLRDDVKNSIAQAPAEFYGHYLQKIMAAGQGRWKALCPLHGDTNPSFTIYPDGHYYCFGCGAAGDGLEFIMRYKNLDFPAALAEAAAIVGVATKLPKGTSQRLLEATYEIREADNTLVAQHLRYRQHNGNKSYTWRRNDKNNLDGYALRDLPLYRLPELATADVSELVVLVEGEKACDALREAGQVAVATYGAKCVPSDARLQPLLKHIVVLWPDNDEAGRDHMEQIGQRLLNLGNQPRLVTWPEAPEKGDAADYLAVHSPDELRGLLQGAEPLTPREPPPATGNGAAREAAIDLPKLPNKLSKAAIRKFALTDAGNAELFVRHWGERLRFDTVRESWFAWEGHRWRETGEDFLVPMALASVRERAAAASTEKQTNWAKSSESRARLKAMTDLARAFPPISSTTVWDSDPLLIGFPNGVMDLDTGKFRDGHYSDRISKSVAGLYDSKAQCPRWQKFLREIFVEDELIEYAHRSLGYSLTGEVREQAFFVLQGPGGNGKTAFLSAFGHALGDYARNVSFQVFDYAARNEHPQCLARLESARFVTASEASEHTRLNQARLKALAGSEPITARLMYQGDRTFANTAKIWLAVNHLPIITDQTDGIWRKIRLLELNQQFIGANADLQLSEQLKTEAPGILRWAIDGARLWLQEGLNTPQCVLSATQQWRGRLDPLAGFLATCCVVDEEASATANELYGEYCRYCTDTNTKPLSSTMFGTRMSERFYKKRGSDPNRKTAYQGIRLNISTTLDSMTDRVDALTVSL